jgi:hypothetical protein
MGTLLFRMALADIVNLKSGEEPIIKEQDR